MIHVDFQKVWNIVFSGGPLMIPLLVLAILLYANIVSLLRFVIAADMRSLLLKELDAEPLSRTAIIDFRKHLSNLITTQLTFSNVLIVAAPLLGLLGTIMGMLETFRGLGEFSEDKAQVVSDGVKVALITTQTGLMIAIVGLFLSQWITRLYKKKDMDLVDLEFETLKKESWNE